MKLVLLPILLLAAALGAPAEEKSAAAPTAKKKDCPLCKLPGRAALFAGKTKSCPADCTKLCCKGVEVSFIVAGMSCERCSNKVTTAFAKLEGVKVEKVDHESGLATLKYDPAKTKAEHLSAIIAKCGYKVTGEQVSFVVAGLADEKNAQIVEEALVKSSGVTRIVTVCNESGRAIVNFDPAQTDRAKIAAAINTTAFKVSP